jgi:glycosyltransferase involved in cell wall biosynthesis
MKFININVFIVVFIFIIVSRNFIINYYTIKISIVMPIHNGIEFINESVDSVLEQTYDNWELIIGINGHPPDSEVYKIAKQLENVDNRIHVYDFHEVRGKASTLNEMLKYCLGDYIAILDVDDVWYSNKIELQLPFLYKYDVIGAKCIYFGNLNGTITDIPTGDISDFDFKLVNPICNSSSMIKKKLCYWSNTYFGLEDYEMWLSLRKSGKSFYNCKEVLVKHRIHSKSSFNAKGNNNGVNDLLISYDLKI